MFPSNVRYSGASLGYQLAAPIGGGIVPVVAAALIGMTHGSTWPVSVMMIVIALITLVAILAAKETAPSITHKTIFTGGEILATPEPVSPTITKVV
jgi:MHS family shikimate/dehydroshikimate transporter-like MFS transporter